jgi:hypothetical protein
VTVCMEDAGMTESSSATVGRTSQNAALVVTP